MAFVDHKLLMFTMAKVAELWSARQQRHLSFISEFTTDIQHLAGKHKLAADRLSITGAVHLGLEYARMAGDQVSDLGVQAGQLSLGYSWRMLLSMELETHSCVTFPQISPCWVETAGLSHPGRKPSQRPVAAKFIWHGFKTTCRVGLTPVWGIKALKGTPPQQSTAGAVLGPLHTHYGGQDSIPLSSTTSTEADRAFSGTRVAWFSALSDVSSDGGSLGVKLHCTTCRLTGCALFHRTMKDARRASLKDDGWVDRLPWVTLGPGGFGVVVGRM